MFQPNQNSERERESTWGPGFPVGPASPIGPGSPCGPSGPGPPGFPSLPGGPWEVMLDNITNVQICVATNFKWFQLMWRHRLRSLDLWTPNKGVITLIWAGKYLSTVLFVDFNASKNLYPRPDDLLPISICLLFNTHYWHFMTWFSNREKTV